MKYLALRTYSTGDGLVAAFFSRKYAAPHPASLRHGGICPADGGEAGRDGSTIREDRTLEGVRLTHQPSPWIGDYGALLFMPQAGKPETSSERRWSAIAQRKRICIPII